MPRPPKPTISDAKMAKVMRYVNSRPGSKRRDIIREAAITHSEWDAARRHPQGLLAYVYFPTGWFCPAGATELDRWGTGSIEHGNHGWHPQFIERCDAFLAANPPEEA